MRASRGRGPHWRPAGKQHEQTILDAFGEAEAERHFLIRREPDHALTPKHLALTLGAVRIEESSMNATRLAGERVGHQRNDGADTLVPPKRVGQVIKQSNVQPATFREVPPAERERVPPTRAQRLSFFPDAQASLDARLAERSPRSPMRRWSALPLAALGERRAA